MISALLKTFRLLPILILTFSMTLISAQAQFAQQGKKLVGTFTRAVPGPGQGSSVSLSNDGNTLAVGGPYALTGTPGSMTGATWIFTRSGGIWTQQALLVGAGWAGAGPLQGFSVSLSGDGNTLAIGGPADNSSVGATWIFTRSGSVWTQQGNKLVGTGSAAPSSQGSSVWLTKDGNTLAVGGYEDNQGIGAAWIFTRSSGGVWTQQGNKLVATALASTGFTSPGHQGVQVYVERDANTKQAHLALWGLDIYNHLSGVFFFATQIGNGATWLQTTPNPQYPAGIAGVPSWLGRSTTQSSDGKTLAIGNWNDNNGVGATFVFTQ